MRKYTKPQKINFKLEDVEIEEVNPYHWEAKIKGKQLSTFLYILDQEKIWLNFCYNENGDNCKKGLGSKMVQYAVKKYGAVYFCSLPKDKLIAHLGILKNDETRYLSKEGHALAKSCTRKKIIKPEWYTAPDKPDIDEINVVQVPISQKWFLLQKRLPLAVLWLTNLLKKRA